MKTIQKISFLMILLLIAAAGCKKDPVMYSKGLESFALVEKDESGAIVKEYPGTINGDEITVPLPIEVDVTRLTVNFTAENVRTIVQVGNEVQEPGVTVQDFTQPVAFRIKAEDRSTRTYQVKVEKKIALETFGFFKEDNPALEDDYKGVIRGLTIDIAVPESIDLTKLVARFQTTSGATLKIGAATQQSKVTVNDFTNPVQYTFVDPLLSVAELTFTARVSFIGPKWWMIGDKNIIVPTADELKLAINPITRYPHVAYIRTGKDESGTTIAPEERKVAVIGFTGAGWKHLGSSLGISDNRAADLSFEFNSEGMPYVGYEDYSDYNDIKQGGTVLRYEDEAWKTVGGKNFTPMRVDKYSFTIGENDQPVVAATTFTAIPGYLKRAIYSTNYVSGSWNNITPTVANPLTGSLSTFRGLDGKTYLAVVDRDNMLSMFKLINNVWTAVGPTRFRAADNLPPYTSVIGAANVNGEVYIGYQTVVSSERINRILRFNPATSTWEELGSAGNSQGITDQYALAIAPNGTLYFAFANNSGLYVRTFNDATRNWNNPRLVVSGKINGFDIKVSSDGIPYLAVNTNIDNKTAVYKYTPTK